MPMLASIHIPMPCFRPTTPFVGDEVLEAVGGTEEVAGAERAVDDERPEADVRPGLAAAAA